MRRSRVGDRHAGKALWHHLAGFERARWLAGPLAARPARPCPPTSAEGGQRGLPLLLALVAVQAGHWHVASPQLALCSQKRSPPGRQAQPSGWACSDVMCESAAELAWLPARLLRLRGSSSSSSRQQQREGQRQVALAAGGWQPAGSSCNGRRTCVLEALLEVHEHKCPLHSQRVDAPPAGQVQATGAGKGEGWRLQPTLQVLHWQHVRIQRTPTAFAHMTCPTRPRHPQQTHLSMSTLCCGAEAMQWCCRWGGMEEAAPSSLPSPPALLVPGL